MVCCDCNNTVCFECGRCKCPEWIKCSDQQPPKNRIFLFSYFAGKGVGHWGECFTTIIGNSERTHEAYILYNACEYYDGNGLKEYTWDEDYMISMEVEWMLFPEESKKDQ